MRKGKSFAISFLIIIAIQIRAQEPLKFFPDTCWIKCDSTEQAGYDSKKIDNVLTYVIDSLNTTGLVVVVDGKILFDYGDTEELSYIASCRKSILSMMYGRYVENGTIKLDKSIAELGISDLQGLLPAEQKATVRNLMTARSGIYHPASNPGDDTKHAPPRGSVKPGSYFIYNNWDFNATGGIFEKLTHKNIYRTFEQDIAIPIQMQDYMPEKQKKTGDSTKSCYLAYHFWLSARDMARLGLLMLNNGNWNGNQIIPEDWVKLTTSIVTPFSQFNPERKRNRNVAAGYGYMWWIWYDENKIFDGAYYASGSYGQYLLIIPKLNMIIAHKTKSDYKRKTSFVEFKKLAHKIADAKQS